MSRMCMCMQNYWRELYREALEELDPVRIEEAQEVIRSRVMEIWYVGSAETEEHRELSAAIHVLNLFALPGKAGDKGFAALKTSKRNYDA
jgi:hypothetical protein